MIFDGDVEQSSFVIVVGDPKSGFSYFGPYDQFEIKHAIDAMASEAIGDWWVVPCDKMKPKERERVKTEHTILVAFTCEAPEFFSAKDVQEDLMAAIKTIDFEKSKFILSWWIAEDERYDKSDNQSAIFIPHNMTQSEAIRYMLRGERYEG